MNKYDVYELRDGVRFNVELNVEYPEWCSLHDVEACEAVKAEKRGWSKARIIANLRVEKK